jgi:hypothetical protein
VLKPSSVYESQQIAGRTEKRPTVQVQKKENPIFRTLNSTSQEFTVSNAKSYNHEKKVDRRANAAAATETVARLPPRPRIDNINLQYEEAAPRDSMPFVNTHVQFKSISEADFGVYGQDPRERTARSGKEISVTASSSSRDLFAGTSKITRNPPGYSGFVPSSDLNATATSQSQRPVGRESLRDAIPNLAITAALPGYAGHLPQGNTKIRTGDPRCTMAGTIGVW